MACHSTPELEPKPYLESGSPEPPTYPPGRLLIKTGDAALTQIPMGGKHGCRFCDLNDQQQEKQTSVIRLGDLQQSSKKA